MAWSTWSHRAALRETGRPIALLGRPATDAAHLPAATKRQRRRKRAGAVIAGDRRPDRQLQRLLGLHPSWSI